VLYLGFLKFLKRDKGKEPDLNLENMEDLDVPPLPPDFEKKGLGEVKEEFPEMPEIGGKGPFPPMKDKPISDLDLPREKPLSELRLPKEKPVSGLELPELPEMPEIGVKEPFPPMKDKPISDLDLPPEGPIPELELPKEKPVSEFELPSLPSPKIEEDVRVLEEAPKIPPLGKPLFGMPKPMPFGVQKPKVDMSELPRLKPEIRPYERLEKAAVREERAVLRHEKAEGLIYIRVERFRYILTGTRTIKNNLKTASQSIVRLNEIDINKDKVFEKWHNVLMDLQKKLIFIDKTLFKKI